jgi:hypothetical protein
MAPSDINAVWAVEKSMDVKRVCIFSFSPVQMPPRGQVLTHEQDHLLLVDLFDEFVAPYLLDARESWDNFSVDIEYAKRGTAAWQNPSDIEKNSQASFDACQETCRIRPDCLTFSMRQGTCGLGTKIRLARDMSQRKKLGL